MGMIVNNLMLASFCNDSENAKDYRIVGDKCYYKDEFIGEIKEELDGTVLDIYFIPVKSLEYIDIKFTIEKSYTKKLIERIKTYAIFLFQEFWTATTIRISNTEVLKLGGFIISLIIFLLIIVCLNFFGVISINYN